MPEAKPGSPEKTGPHASAVTKLASAAHCIFINNVRIGVDAVEKRSLRTSSNSDSADCRDHLLGGGDDGAAE